MTTKTLFTIGSSPKEEIAKMKQEQPDVWLLVEDDGKEFLEFVDDSFDFPITTYLLIRGLQDKGHSLKDCLEIMEYQVAD